MPLRWIGVARQAVRQIGGRRSTQRTPPPCVSPARNCVCIRVHAFASLAREVLERAHAVLAKLNGRAAALRAAAEEGDWGVVPKPPLVVMYGHSMMGAAIGVLTGNGKTVDGEAFLGFDGKYILPNATPVYLAKQGGGAGY